MTKQETWARRVAEWRASGVSMGRFCRAKEYSSGALYYWARKMDEAGTPPAKVVRLARVVRTAQASRGVIEGEEVGDPTRPRTPAGAVVIELGHARVVVEPGVERAVLATVLELLGARRVAEPR